MHTLYVNSCLQTHTRDWRYVKMDIYQIVMMVISGPKAFR